MAWDLRGLYPSEQQYKKIRKPAKSTIIHTLLGLDTGWMRAFVSRHFVRDPELLRRVEMVVTEKHSDSWPRGYPCLLLSALSIYVEIAQWTTNNIATKKKQTALNFLSGWPVFVAPPNANPFFAVRSWPAGFCRTSFGPSPPWATPRLCWHRWLWSMVVPWEDRNWRWPAGPWPPWRKRWGFERCFGKQRKA